MTQRETIAQTKEIDAIYHPERQSDAWNTGADGVPSEMASLEEMRGQLGVLLVPGYLPDGFARTESYVHIGRSGHLGYANQDGDLLMILQDVLPASLEVKTGSVSEAQIGTGRGELIRGGWHQVFRDSGASPVEWDWDSMTTLLFEKAGRWIVLMGIGSESIRSEAVLIRIAESLSPY